MPRSELIATAVLGLSAGYSTAVWAILAWSSRRHFWRLVAYTLLVGATGIVSVLVAAILINRPLELHPLAAPAILIPVFVLPALLQLQSWMAASRLVGDRVVAGVDAGRLVAESPELEVSANPDPARPVEDLTVTTEPPPAELGGDE